MRRGTDWIIDQNFTGANFKINDTSTGSGALAYLIAYETYDRYLLLWEFPAQGSGASEGTCRLSLRGTAATNFDETFKIDWTEPPVIYGSLNPSRYITGERLQKASNSDNLATIYCAKQLGDFSGTVKQFFMSVKKLNEGWSS